MSIDPLDYEYIRKHYGKLIEYAANRIGGDLATDRDDYSQEIWKLVLEYLPRYMLKHGCKTAEEFCAKYPKHVKQWIWTARNHIGADITKKINVKKHESLEYIIELCNKDEELRTHVVVKKQDEQNKERTHYIDKLTKHDDPATYSAINNITRGKDIESKILFTLLTDPDSTKANGSVNMSAISRKLKIPLSIVISKFKEIKKEYNYEG